MNNHQKYIENLQSFYGHKFYEMLEKIILSKTDISQEKIRSVITELHESIIGRTFAENKREEEISSNHFDHWKFASMLRFKRNKDLKINIREAAIQIGISAPTLSRLENCNSPDLLSYRYCCRWLNVDMNYFFYSSYE